MHLVQLLETSSCRQGVKDLILQTKFERPPFAVWVLFLPQPKTITVSLKQALGMIVCMHGCVSFVPLYFHLMDWQIVQKVINLLPKDNWRHLPTAILQEYTGIGNGGING